MIERRSRGIFAYASLNCLVEAALGKTGIRSQVCRAPPFSEHLLLFLPLLLQIRGSPNFLGSLPGGKMTVQ